jgi:ADP-ribosylglycohydrolase
MQTNQTKQIPPDHSERMTRALLSFDGLSVGDGFGETFFTSTEVFATRLQRRELPPSPWIVTDDTTMALSILRCLRRSGYIDQDNLAKAFAQEYVREPDRGYGGMAQRILHAINQGMSWKVAASRAFDGEGSCGNGGAMRSAPIGAYFADDYDRVAYEAKLSAEVTHAHPDGKTGAMAVALAAAWMVREGKCAKQIPQTDTFHCLERALQVPFDVPPYTAASILGNGSRVISSDTVPFCLWCAARHADSFVDALWATVSGFGDLDTTCAIVGGIVALGAGRDAIPTEWIRAREPINI